MTTKIFNDFIRKDLSEKNISQGDYEYLNMSKRFSAQLLRNVINNWFDAYNQEIQDSAKVNDLKSRLQNGKNDQHVAAFFELYLFILLKNLGFKIIAEPSIPGYTTKPDFLAICPHTGKKLFYLEATIVSEGKVNLTREKSIQLVADKINKNVNNSNYSIDLNWHGICSEHDVNKSIIKEIQVWINNTPLESSKEFKFKNWFLLLEAQKTFFPLKKIVAKIYNIKVQCLSKKTEINVEKDEKEIIEYKPENRMDATSRIQNAILEKIKKYGALEIPYIIAINMNSPFFYFDKISLFEALIGREVVYFYENGEMVETRLDDGIWRKDKKEDSTYNTGVLSFFNLVPWTIFSLNKSAKNVPLFPLNPYVKNDYLPLELLDLLDENSCLINLEKLQSIMALSQKDWQKALEMDENTLEK